MRVTRLRQAVVAATDRERFRVRFTEAFGVGEPFADPGVGEFGLHNYVFPVGDAFVEVVSPVREGTTAGRLLERNGGDCGYMAIFQVADIEACRAHLRDLGVRMIWTHDSDGIGSVHIHPQDVGGAIVSFDEPRPVGAWPWGGPGWVDRARNETVSGLAGLTISAAEPALVVDVWSRVLAAEVVADDDAVVMSLPDGSQIRFVPDPSLPVPRLTGISLRASGQGAPSGAAVLAGTRFDVI